MNRKSNISAFILCGGKSLRMGTEKGMVHYNNKPFIQWVIDAVQPIVKNIFLVTDNEEYSKFGYPLVSDIHKNKGPVGGIYSALVRSESDSNLILSCDVPNISTSVLQNYLIDNLTGDEDVTFLSDDKNVYPLIAIYNKRVLPKFLKAINSDNLKLKIILRELESKNIKVDKACSRFLININSKEELKKLEKKQIEISTK